MSDDSPRVKAAVIQPVKGSTDWDLLMTTAEGMKVSFRLDLLAVSLLEITMELLRPVLVEQVESRKNELLKRMETEGD